MNQTYTFDNHCIVFFNFLNLKPDLQIKVLADIPKACSVASHKG